MANLDLNEGYARSTKGLLKIFVIITTCVAFAVYIDHYGRVHYGRGDFFTSVHIAGFAIAIIIFLVFLVSLENSLGSARCWNILNMVASLILGILCIVSSALVIGDSGKRAPDPLIAAIVFGFISGVLFLVDALIHFKEIR
ncbi:uncharacterized protein LOC116303976 [Actinia tenebrosa]|uniref:Uncharacterized protein LOC116303976 n=1 Tax=Actinia tenebrosa TaxID=6105 RepID=A0A6P8IR97_ACTTE|nr:uncharacterized protein LOC116303976 [Actinia tenebrosa]